MYLAKFYPPSLFVWLFCDNLRRGKKNNNVLRVRQLLFTVEPLFFFSCQPGAKAALATEVSRKKKYSNKNALGSSVSSDLSLICSCFLKEIIPKRLKKKGHRKIFLNTFCDLNYCLYLKMCWNPKRLRLG